MKKNQPKTLSKKLMLHRETILTLDVYLLNRAAGMRDTSEVCKLPTWCECWSGNTMC